MASLAHTDVQNLSFSSMQSYLVIYPNIINKFVTTYTEIYKAWMHHALLKDVTSDSQRWTIRTRVTRFFEYKNKEEPPETVRIDLILLDEQGTTMEGQIPQRCIGKYMPQLKEDSLYYIKYFEVCSARQVYRPVDHAYMMRFTSYTEVTEIKTIPDSFPKYACSIATFEVLRGRIGTNEYCSDTIGVFTGCTHVRVQNTKTGPKKLRNVYLTDGSETATVALWNEHAELFNAEYYMQMGTQGPLVFLFVAFTCGQFQRKLSLQGSALCKWYANPEIPEVAALQDRCAAGISTPTWHRPAVAQINPQKITVTELAKFDNPHIIYDNRYIVEARMKSVATNQSWWYTACDNCNRAAQPQGDKYKCPTANCPCTNAAPRYCLPIVATDPIPSPSQKEEHTVQLVFFGSIAQEIIGSPVDTLIASQGGSGNSIPASITALCGRQFELRVSPSRASLRRGSITYSVDNIVGAANVSMPLAPTLEPPLLQQSQSGSTQHIVTASTDSNLARTMSTTCTSSSPPGSEMHTPTKETETNKADVPTTPQPQHTPPVSEASRLKRTFKETQNEETDNNSGGDDTPVKGPTRRRLNVEDHPEQD